MPRPAFSPLPLVVLHGPAGVGKDYAFKVIEDLHVVHARRWSVADLIKVEVHRARGLNPDPRAFETMKETPLKEFDGRSPREAYIAHGNAVRQSDGADAWVRRLVDAITAGQAWDAYFGQRTLHVVTDCRLATEWDVYSALASGAVLWRVHCPGVSWRLGDVGDRYLDAPGRDLLNSMDWSFGVEIEKALDDLLAAYPVASAA